MVFYFKVNRKDLYTFRNLQHWIHIMEYMSDSRGFILCDNRDLKQAILERVEFSGDKVAFLESCRDTPDMEYLVSNITEECWRNAGYAHITTFWHAKENGYPHFWNIDADDTCICLSPLRACELLSEAERYATENQIVTFSLDMWVTRTKGHHWSFGVTYIDNTVDWYGVMTEYCENGEFKSGQIRNVDGYFSCLKEKAKLKIETFYAENLKFVHYSDDFLKRPDISGVFHWKDGKLILPILKYCLGLDAIGTLRIADGIVKLCIGITDEETAEFMFHYAAPGEQERLKDRMAAEAGEDGKGR